MTEHHALDGMNIAILVTDGFEQSELEKPRMALEAAGARTFVVSPKERTVQGVIHHERGLPVDFDVRLREARPDSFDALLLPGGVANPDALRTIPDAVAFVKRMGETAKPIAAICHGPWTLIDAGLVKGKQMTSWPSLRSDLKNAGASWSDTEVVVDRGLVTSRKPDDIPAFNREMVRLFATAARLKEGDSRTERSVA